MSASAVTAIGPAGQNIAIRKQRCLRWNDRNLTRVVVVADLASRSVIFSLLTSVAIERDGHDTRHWSRNSLLALLRVGYRGDPVPDYVR
jgi:hypothetical protein